VDDIVGLVLTQLALFLPVVVLLVLVPGANNLHVLRTAVEAGTRAACLATVGTSTGIAAWSVAVALGLGGVVAALPGGLGTLQVAGSLAMVAMGLWALVPKRPSEVRVLPRSAAVAGAVVCIANPRTPLMAVSLLPQFALTEATGVSTVALGLEWAAVAGAWNLMCLALARGRIDGRSGAVVARLGGVLVCGLGVAGLVGQA
jgi:threonine/homoserine/homoserine lactone efflux protein